MIFIRDRSVSDLATVGVDVSVFPRVDALPRKSNVVSDLTLEERVSGVVPAGLDERDSILLTTLDGVAFTDSRATVGVVFFAAALAVLVDRVFPGVIVRAARLLVFVLAVEGVLVWTGAVREATPTVRVEFLPVDTSRAGLEAVEVRGSILLTTLDGVAFAA